jgi:hypothetical protein
LRRRGGAAFAQERFDCLCCAEIGIKLFLNCTKNTELTCAPFDRKVKFALSNKPLVWTDCIRAKKSNEYSAAPELHAGQLVMKSGEWKTYRTRFLVKAKQLSSSLSFVDPLGRQHSGRKGDYLVESSDGVISIAPRQIFEDIYVAIASEREGKGVPAAETCHRRKMPQPCRDRRDSTQRMGMM